MTEQRWSFFKDGDSSFGMFYPKHYTLAGFERAADAQEAAGALRDDGVDAQDIRVVSGQFLLEELESQHDASWLDRMKSSIAEFIGTETYFIDQDIALAHRGGAFLFVYTPEDEPARQIEEIIARHEPVYARRYLAMAIERLIEPPASLTSGPETA